MDRLRMAPDERVDNIHIETLQNGVEGLARSLVRLLVPTGTAGSGTIGGSAAYDSGTQCVTLSNLVAVDGEGNVVLPTGSVVSDPIAGADIGVTPLYVWVCVVPGSVQSAPGKRVRWVSGAPKSFSTYTKFVDSIQAAVSPSQPLPLTVERSTGVESYQYFKVFSITEWSGDVPNLPTFAYVSPLAMGASSVPGSVLGILEYIVAAMGAIKSSGGGWTDVVAAGASLDELDGRAAALEAEGFPARVLALEGPLRSIPLTGGVLESGSATYGANGWTFGASASHVMRIGLDVPNGRSLGNSSVQFVTDALSTCSVTIREIRLDSGAEVNVANGVSWIAGEGYGSKTLTPIGVVTFDVETCRYELYVEVATGLASAPSLRGALLNVNP